MINFYGLQLDTLHRSMGYLECIYSVAVSIVSTDYRPLLDKNGDERKFSPDTRVGDIPTMMQIDALHMKCNRGFESFPYAIV